MSTVHTTNNWCHVLPNSRLSLTEWALVAYYEGFTLTKAPYTHIPSARHYFKSSCLRLLTSSRSWEQLTNSPLWATAMAPWLVCTTKGWQLTSSLAALVEYLQSKCGVEIQVAIVQTKYAQFLFLDKGGSTFWLISPNSMQLVDISLDDSNELRT